MMIRLLPIMVLLVFWRADGLAEEAGVDPAVSRETDTQAEEPDATALDSEPQGDGIESPRSMSGMSILGNEEAPKALVIIPWKSSQLGEEINLSDTLNDRALPVDKEVFLRELRFYEIRSEK